MSGSKILKIHQFAEGNATSITGSYTAIIDSLPPRVRRIDIMSSLDGDILLSFDGTNNHYRIPEPPLTGEVDRTPLLVSIEFHNDDSFGYKGNDLYIKDGSSAPTAGTISITVWHGE